ncbi:phosphoacetylglucosamine mutase [Strongylocentrotus purpuratus]|uniref:Phosphoacetylglucosamine mutase n=1 Tax=Strongylocentrotus purpuratus TaxID=7668 RepID=A0A7M7NVC3_STRPU|nr:phosphoacetylglucosamine mutase [Strongylocentrotus purpuratus]
MEYFKKIATGSSRHCKPIDQKYSYGTAGFRCRANLLDSVMYRMGILAALRSKQTKATVGVMITASHNPEEDNGVKLVEPMGEMLVPNWEGYASRMANSSDEDLECTVKTVVKEAQVDILAPANVFIARDTRPSSVVLAQSLKDGVTAMEGQLTDYGLLSTPQLHYMVRCYNTKQAYGQHTEQGYYQKLAHAFHSLHKLNDAGGGDYSNQILLDGANGVGALKVMQFLNHLETSLLNITVCNDGSNGKLNEMCGADYVKIQQKPSSGMPSKVAVKCVSFDGDADRIVYFYTDTDQRFHLLDGDKLATLIAGYIQELLTQSGSQLKMGLVQTAYANGSSTKYASETLKVPVACVSTGVKHLHHKAEDFDIGVYFEANGHGTVLYSKNAEEKIQQASQDQSLSNDQRKSATILKQFIDLTNQTVGDALCDLLLVETILWAKRWTVEAWDASYTDLPNRQLKVKVADRTAIQTTDAERQCTRPVGLQDVINSLVANYQTARSFVRPSGTEDVVRVYAEAATREQADKLAYEVAGRVYDLTKGVGDRPVVPTS